MIQFQFQLTVILIVNVNTYLFLIYRVVSYTGWILDWATLDVFLAIQMSHNVSCIVIGLF